MDLNTENIELIEDRANLKILGRLLLNNKFLILQITAIIFIAFFYIAKTSKKVWQGQFQIVLQSKSDKRLNPTSLLDDSGLADLLSKSSSKDLKTQIEILKSPSVLIPTFNFVKENNKFSVPLRFQSWRKKNLDIKLKPGTRVMDLSYKDHDKDIILPTLQKISKTYQEYALLEKSRISKSYLSFLEKKIESYKEISDKSINSLKKYAAENKLTPFTPNSLLNPSTIIGREGEFEGIKYNAEINLVEVDKLIKQVEELGLESDALLYLDNMRVLQDPVLINIKRSINTLDQNISNLKTKYTEKDPALKRLIRERNSLLTNFRNQYLNKLQGLRIQAVVKRDTLSRPNDVLLRYAKLTRQATSDLNSLLLLQKENEFAKIKDAQKLEPWKLITNPTLLSYPVAPNKKRLYFIGILSGLFFGSLFAYLKDKSQGKIYTQEEIEELLDIPIIISLNPKNENQSNQLIRIFAEQTAKGLGKNKLNFLALDAVQSSQSEEFLSRLKQYIDKDKVLFNKDIFIDESNLFVNYLLITLTKTNKKTILDLKNKLSLVDKQIKGIILIDQFIKF